MKEEPIEEVDEDEAELPEEDDDELEKKKRKEEIRKKLLRPIKKEPASLVGDTNKLRVRNGNTDGKGKNVGQKRKRGASEEGTRANENGAADPTAKKWVRYVFSPLFYQ